MKNSYKKEIGITGNLKNAKIPEFFFSILAELQVIIFQSESRMTYSAKRSYLKGTSCQNFKSNPQNSGRAT